MTENGSKPEILITEVKVNLVLTQEQLDIFGQRGIELLNNICVSDCSGDEESDHIISEIVEATHVAVQRHLGI